MGPSNLAIPVASAFINVFSKGNLYLERGVDVYIELEQTKFLKNGPIYEGFYNFKPQHCPHLVIFIIEYFDLF